MFWADKIAKEIQHIRTTPIGGGKKLLIRDEKTMSGRVHIGSMRGVAIHGLVAEVLSEYGIENEYRYELNDFDDFDSIPGYLDADVFTEHLGKPLYKVPSPVEGFANYAEYFATEFVAVHKKAGFTPNYYRATELYQSGQMDECIRTALTKTDDIRRILKEVSNSVKDETWLPISVICEKCEKLKTTRAYDFDGETVGYSCDQSPYASVPCGYEGRVAPWKGAAKLFWKVDWAAKWVVQGVDIEGAGKDHSTKGGSRDVAKHIAKEVYGFEPPFDIPYEFFLVGGMKMSSSKGRGSTAHEMAQLFTPEVLRLSLIGKDINQQINVDPAGDSVPRMYDWYDDLAQNIRDGVADDFTRLYVLTQLPENQAGADSPWHMRFGLVAFIVQMPHLNLEQEAEITKGSPLTDEEKELLAERARYAKFWLDTYAPEQYKYVLQTDISEGVVFSDTQKEALKRLHTFIEEGQKTGEELHQRLHELKSEVPIEPKELFSALYTIFLGRTSGPKAGWFLSVLPHEIVLSQLEKALK
jgi:lysyl-tRNA synthetase class 1